MDRYVDQQTRRWRLHDDHRVNELRELSRHQVTTILDYPHNGYGALGWVFPTWARRHALDTGEAVNILKGAIVTADRILTVGQDYSWEITTPEGGNGLDELLTSRKTVVNDM